MIYPIEIQSFDQIVEDEYVYVDKTALVYSLVKEGKTYFLSRPLRFGKNLLVSTLKNYFLGKKEIFKGLAIDSLEKEWLVYPVFHIDFNGSNFLKGGTLENVLEGHVSRWEEDFGVVPDKNLDLGLRFIRLLEQVYKQSGRRVDCIVKTDDYIYIFEFKLDGFADEALRQLEEKGYIRPYIVIIVNYSVSG